MTDAMTYGYNVHNPYVRRDLFFFTWQPFVTSLQQHPSLHMPLIYVVIASSCMLICQEVNPITSRVPQQAPVPPTPSRPLLSLPEEG
jgi:hypothetical protein